MKLAVILGSTREGRVTERMAKWIAASAAATPDVMVDLIDLRDFPMPFFNEPKSPRYNSDRHIDPTAQKWLTRIIDADAYIFVTPEYNHSIPGVLKNAIDYITWEMVHKPATVASHGTVGGARATLMLKEILSESRAAIIPTQLAIPHVSELLDAEGNPVAAEQEAEYGIGARLGNMLDELKWYSDALAAARGTDS